MVAMTLRRGILSILPLLILIIGQNPLEIQINNLPLYTIRVYWDLPAGAKLADYSVLCSDGRPASVAIKRDRNLGLKGAELFDLEMCLTYTCSLMNVGAVAKAFDVIVNPPIPTIKNLQISQITQGGFAYSFLAPDNISPDCGPISYKYELLYKNKVVESNDGFTTTRGAFTTLFPSTAYTLRVAAVIDNFKASGPYQQADTTTFDGILDPPSNLKKLDGIKPAGNEYYLEWTAPNNPNNYPIFYEVKTMNTYDNKETFYKAYDTDVLLDNLKYCSSYISKVYVATIPLANSPSVISKASNEHKFDTGFPFELEPIQGIRLEQVSETSVKVMFDQQNILKENPSCSYTNHVIVTDEFNNVIPKYETITKATEAVVNNLEAGGKYKFNVITKATDNSVSSKYDAITSRGLELEKGRGWTVGRYTEDLLWWHILLIVLAVLVVVAVLLSIIF